MRLSTLVIIAAACTWPNASSFARRRRRSATWRFPVLQAIQGWRGQDAGLRRQIRLGMTRSGQWSSMSGDSRNHRELHNRCWLRSIGAAPSLRKCDLRVESLRGKERADFAGTKPSSAIGSMRVARRGATPYSSARRADASAAVHAIPASRLNEGRRLRTAGLS